MRVKRKHGAEEEVCDVCGSTNEMMMHVQKETENHVVLAFVCKKHVDPSILPWKLEEEAWKVVRAVETIATLIELAEPPISIINPTPEKKIELITTCYEHVKNLRDWANDILPKLEREPQFRVTHKGRSGGE